MKAETLSQTLVFVCTTTQPNILIRSKISKLRSI